MKEPKMKHRVLISSALLAAALAAGTPALAADTLVPVSGIVSGSPESVSFSGEAVISSRLVPDPDFGRAALLLVIDLSGISGVGASTRMKYEVATREKVQRRVAPSHTVQVSFPFITTGATVVGSGVASFALDIDVNTGAVTSATASVSAPGF
jgi:hypothetical protein